MTNLYEQLLSSASSEPSGVQGAAGSTPRPRASAAVVPWRRDPDGEVEVFWVRRAPGVPFMAGWHAFPGGGVSRHDAGLRIQGLPHGLAPESFTDPLPGLDDRERADLGPDLVPGLLAATLRELFEETGLLLLESGGGERTPTACADEEGRDLDPLRARLIERQTDLARLVASEGWRLDASELVFAGRWLTPPLAPLRFDNRFFLLHWPADRPLQPRILEGELDRGEWIRPAAALEAWRHGEVWAAPPIVHFLRVLAEDGPEAGLPRLLDPSEVDLGPMRRVEFRPGIILLPLRTATLLPATHTHAFLVGTESAVLIDPGCTDGEETDRLMAALRAFEDQGGSLREVWLTHHHPDHTGAVAAVRDELGVPVRAHPTTAAILRERGLEVVGDLDDGALVELGGASPLRLRVLHTPGHARGHLAFFEEVTRSLLAGDLVSALSTIVIDPPDGDMDDYLASLERVAALEPSAVFPAHGPVLLGSSRLLETREHRLEREREVAVAWRAGARSAGEITRQVYVDAPEAVLPLAERQVQAHLDRLARR